MIVFVGVRTLLAEVGSCLSRPEFLSACLCGSALYAEHNHKTAMNLQQHGSSSQDGSLLPECSSPILPELMIMLPGLHPSHLVSTGIISLKRLRLVCKELNSLSLTAMRYCEVHVGEGWCPPRAQQLVRFVGQVEQRQLRQLRINLTVTSGEILLNVQGMFKSLGLPCHGSSLLSSICALYALTMRTSGTLLFKMKMNFVLEHVSYVL